MPRPHARIRLAFVTAAIGLGCAASEPVDIAGIGARRHPDASDPISGTAGTFGIAGASGSAGTMGAAGTGISTTSGQPSSDGGAGSAAVDANVGSGQAGAGGAAGAGAGGTSTGRGGTSGGRGGAGGTAGSSGAADAGNGSDAAAAATFTEIYMSILTPYCAGSNCHNPGSERGISFATQATAYTAVRNRVTPGNGTGSSFYRTVNGGSMPPGGNKLSAADLVKIRAWIDAGAPNN